MDSSYLLRIRQENQPKYIRNNPTTDSSTLTWKRQLQSAGGTRKTSTFNEVCDAYKIAPITNHFSATSVDAKSDCQTTLLYKTGQQSCNTLPLYAYISTPTLEVPTNPILGRNPAGPCDGVVIPLKDRFRYTCDSNGPCTGKGMVYPSA